MISTVSLFRESTKATKPYEYREILDKLQGAKRDIIEYVIEEGGAVRQTDIVQGTGLSKGTVSRTLKGLCDIGLVEKDRHGSSNIISIKRYKS